MFNLTRRTKNVLILLLVVAAYGLVGYMDANDADCSWNGCGEERYSQE